jgi:chemotaxis protein methyltransferase CheR
MDVMISGARKHSPLALELARHTGLAIELIAEKLEAFANDESRRGREPLHASLDALDSQTRARLIEALLIQETFFFRHPGQLELLREDVLPRLFQTRRAQASEPFVAWCAGCATGEEAWSLAFLLAGTCDGKQDIVGTDLSNAAIAIARRGFYRRLESMGSFREIPAFARSAFPCKGGETWMAPPALRAKVRFEVRNILEPPPVTRADVIFCRNVLIYFSREAANAVLRTMAGLLQEGGLLVLGAAEADILPELFVPVFGHGTFVFQRNGRAL